MLDSLRRIESIERAINKWLPPEPTDQATRTRTDLSLYDYVPAISPRFARPEHLAPLVDVFQRIDQGEAVRVLVSVPPRHAKTETILHGLSRWIGRNPEKAVAYTSYADRIARSKSRLARDYAMAAGVRLRNDSSALNEWRTSEGGGCLATGVGGPLTGHGIGLLVVDDPHKNRQEAESAIIRDRIHGWFTSTAMTRLEPEASALVVHTRWHPDDLIGRLEKDSEVAWEVINLPAIDDAGAALWPSRWPVDALEKRRREVGEYDWWSLYQGRPRPRGGKVFREVYEYSGPIPNGHRFAIGIDCAYTAKTSSDWSVIVVLAEVGGVYYVVKVVRLQVEPEALAAELVKVQREYPGALTRWFASGMEEAIAKLLRKFGAKISTKPATTDKFVRAQPSAAAWNAGKILIPAGAPWRSKFIQNVHDFTGSGDEADDEIDALAAAHDALQVARYS